MLEQRPRSTEQQQKQEAIRRQQILDEMQQKQLYMQKQALAEQRLKAKRVEAQRAEAQRVEAQRIEAQRIEAQRIEAQRVEAQRAEQQQLIAHNRKIAQEMPHHSIHASSPAPQAGHPHSSAIHQYHQYVLSPTVSPGVMINQQAQVSKTSNMVKIVVVIIYIINIIL